MERPIITLLTDFGERDTFVAQMKGVLLGHCPAAALVDLTHQISPQSILEGALHLAAAWTSFPAGSIHVAVVDPGVGTDRRPIALSFRGHYFVVPDNGLISSVLESAGPQEAVEIKGWDDAGGRISRTFHGRDVFAPAAGLLASGLVLSDLGQRIEPESLVRIDIPAARETEQGVLGEVVLVDHFGNAMTNIKAEALRGDYAELVVECGTFTVPRISLTYQEVQGGEPVALISSMGTLELAVRDGSAAGRYDLQVGTPVIAYA